MGRHSMTVQLELSGVPSALIAGGPTVGLSKMCKDTQPGPVDFVLCTICIQVCHLLVPVQKEVN